MSQGEDARQEAMINAAVQQDLEENRASDRQLNLVRANAKQNLMFIKDQATKEALSKIIEYIDEVRRNT